VIRPQGAEQPPRQKDQGRTRAAAMATDAQHRLFEALKAHTSELEAERKSASGPDQAVFDRRLEAARKLLEWLSTTLELGSPSNSNADLKRCG
jgi:hypothetical protein